MRATIIALGLAAGLFGTAGEASAQFGYPGYGYGYSAYNPSIYGVGRGPFYGGRYLAAPSFGYGGFGGYQGYNAYNYGGFNYGGFNRGYRGFGFPGYGGYRSGFSLNFFRGF